MQSKKVNVVYQKEPESEPLCINIAPVILGACRLNSLILA
jgi:hypothetical protein